MRVLKSISEDEVVLTFLQNELDSERHGSAIREALDELSLPAELITDPHIRDRSESVGREQVLARARGWRTKGLFEGFPEDIVWVKADLDDDDLDRVRFIDYSYWNELSGGTRSPRDGARNARAGVAPFGIPLLVDELVHSIKSAGGWPFAPPILMTNPAHDAFVILEGHVRLTAFLDDEVAAKSLGALVGTSGNIEKWALWGGLA